METFIHDSANNLDYKLCGNQYLPCLATGQSAETSTGTWAVLCKQYLKSQHPARYNQLLLSGSLDRHLAEVDAEAARMFEALVQQMASQEGVTEDLKAQDQMAWVGRMNNIRSRAKEIISRNFVSLN